MEKDTLMKILKEHSMTFSHEEINQLINEEVEKNPDEMDTDLIEICLETLENKSEENHKATPQKNKKIKLKRLLLLVAIIAVILAFAVPAGAKFISVNASQEFISYEDGHFRINMSDNIERTKIIMDIIATLKNMGVEKPVLPNSIISDEYIKYNISSSNNETNFYLLNINSKINGTVLIYDFNNNVYGFIGGTANLNDQYNCIEQMEINGIDVMVFEKNDYSCIFYTYDNHEYTITLNNCDFKTAKEIANTIGE